MDEPNLLFAYAVSPNQVPRSLTSSELSVVELMITVHNPTDQAVACQQLRFTMPPGQAPENLTDRGHVDAIVPSEAEGTKWRIYEEGDGTYSAYPRHPVDGLGPYESIAFVFGHVVVNETPGSAVIHVEEFGATVHSGSVAILKTEPGLSVTRFTAIPVEITPRGEAKLNWKVIGATTRSLTTDTKTAPVNPEGSLPVRPVDTTTYTLTAEGQGSSVQQQVTVSVATVRVLSFGVEPSQVGKDDPATFRWTVQGAESCWLEPDHVRLEPTDHGEISRPVPATGTYTLEARGYGRVDPRTVTVAVMPVALHDVHAAPAVIDPGDDTELHWTADWSRRFRLDPGGEVIEQSHATVQPTETTTYTVTALGLEPKSRRVTVAVGAAITRFGFTADPARPGEVTLAWEVLCGTAELATWTGGAPNPQPVGAVGSRPVAIPADGVTRTALIATGGGSKVTATLAFGGPPVHDGAELTSFEMSSPSGITSPESEVQLTWRADGAALSGEVRGGTRPQQLKTLNGQLEVPLGIRTSESPLWTGDVFVQSRQNRNGVGMNWSIA